MPLLHDTVRNPYGPRWTSPLPGSAQPRKRKQDTENDGGSTESKRAIKKRRSKTSKAHTLEDEHLNVEEGTNIVIGGLNSRSLADYVAQCTKRFLPDLSVVELEDQYLPEGAFVDTSDWDKPRILSNLPDYLDRYGQKSAKSRNLSIASKKLGSPHTLVVTGAGIRAADATRTLRVFQTKDSTVAKLFAKHIKLKEAVNYVKNTRMGIGVGTPSRLIDLLDAGALSSEKLERIVIDCSHIDQKKRGILDMKETQQPLMTFLNKNSLKSRYGQDKDGIDLLFY